MFLNYIEMHNFKEKWVKYQYLLIMLRFVTVIENKSTNSESRLLPGLPIVKVLHVIGWHRVSNSDWQLEDHSNEHATND